MDFHSSLCLWLVSSTVLTPEPDGASGLTLWPGVSQPHAAKKGHDAGSWRYLVATQGGAATIPYPPR